MCRLFPFPPTCSAGTTTILALIGPASAIAGFGPSGLVPAAGFGVRWRTDLTAVLGPFEGSFFITTLRGTEGAG
jgi:hypothetical protein